MGILQIVDKFYQFNDIYKFIDNIQIKSSKFVQVLTIGHTIKGTPLKLFK